MKAVLQRVSSAKVIVATQCISQIARGYVILIGIDKQDSEQDVIKLVEKIIYFRIMADENEKMNKSILDTKSDILVVSQFTLCADLSSGRRPDFFPAKEPKEAERLYKLFVEKLREKGLRVKTGVFGAMMEVQIFNDGPVTFILDSLLI